ncbi:hypothetical protein C8R45DRAFT_943450 [Mycena sanguinolenta]|nr:hypothetical protein C8R45DRAFT_943450 [Mycena sanguinolenta]
MVHLHCPTWTPKAQCAGDDLERESGMLAYSIFRRCLIGKEGEQPARRNVTQPLRMVLVFPARGALRRKLVSAPRPRRPDADTGGRGHEDAAAVRAWHSSESAHGTCNDSASARSTRATRYGRQRSGGGAGRTRRNLMKSSVNEPQGMELADVRRCRPSFRSEDVGRNVLLNIENGVDSGMCSRHGVVVLMGCVHGQRGRWGGLRWIERSPSTLGFRTNARLGGGQCAMKHLRSCVNEGAWERNLTVRGANDFKLRRASTNPSQKMGRESDGDGGLFSRALEIWIIEVFARLSARRRAEQRRMYTPKEGAATVERDRPNVRSAACRNARALDAEGTHQILSHMLRQASSHKIEHGRSADRQGRGRVRGGVGGGIEVEGVLCGGAKGIRHSREADIEAGGRRGGVAWGKSRRDTRERALHKACATRCGELAPMVRISQAKLAPWGLLLRAALLSRKEALTRVDFGASLEPAVDPDYTTNQPKFDLDGQENGFQKIDEK